MKTAPSPSMCWNARAVPAQCGLSWQFILRTRSERFWIASASLPGPRRSHVRCRKTHTSQNDSEQAANPGVPYGKVVRKKFHADSINGRKMTDADWRGVAGAGAGS